MKRTHNFFLFTLFLLLWGAVYPSQAQVTSVPTQMNFQGRIARPDGTPYFDGNYAMRFSLWDAPTGGNEVWYDIQEIRLRNGVFSTVLGTVNPLTESVLAGERWLEMRVETTTITPRQKMLSNAYALRANLANTVPDGSLTLAKFVPGALDSLGWLLGGNAGTNPGSHFLGTTDNQPLVFRTNNTEKLRIDSSGNVGIGTNTPQSLLDVRGNLGVGTANLPVGLTHEVGGHSPLLNLDANFRFGHRDTTYRGGMLRIDTRDGQPLFQFLARAAGSTFEATHLVLTEGGNVGIGTASPAAKLEVAGTAQMIGFQLSTGAAAGSVLASDASGVGTWQTVTSLLGANSITNSMIQSVDWSKITSIPGGLGGSGNSAAGQYATVPGGLANTASNIYATVAGGIQNTASANSATVGGGFQNTASGGSATVAGGYQNTASGNRATVAGGVQNTATGYSSFAAGNRARANHDGAFVWADSTNADFASSIANEFNVRASGGTRIFSNDAATTGVLLAPGGGGWSNASDRNLKANFQPVDVVEVLEKLASLPLTTWNYKANGDIRHMGVMAQDFYAAFGRLGMDDKHIDTVDADGVAFAAIQGLNKKLEATNAELKKENAELKARLETLEAAVQRLTTQPK